MENLLLSSLISAWIGFCLPYLIKIFVYIGRRCSKNNLCGCWYTYSSFVENHSRKMVEGKIQIKKGVLSLYKTKWVENQLEYTGQIQLENNHLIMIQKTKTEIRSETSCIRIDCSQYGNRNAWHGLWLSYDSDNHVCCGAIMLSKKQLPLNIADYELRSFSQIFEGPILRVEN